MTQGSADALLKAATSGQLRVATTFRESAVVGHRVQREAESVERAALSFGQLMSPETQPRNRHGPVQAGS